MDLNGKTALVTGAGKRLGRAIALSLARRGARVAAHYHTSAQDALETAQQCGRLAEAAGGDGESITLGADLTEPDAVTEMFAQLHHQWGGIQVLVNSVGLHEKTPTTLPPPALEDAFDAQLGVNLRSAARCIHHARPQMEARGGGAVVNLTDALLRRPFPGYGPYHAAKVALEALTRTWAVELAPAIRVNAVAPGIVLPAERDSAASHERWKKRIPLGRLGTPAELADAVRFLLESDYITGQVLAVDGGLSWAR